VNAEPHLGHAMEFIRADSIARYRALIGEDVLLNTGTDEHGLKIYRKALELHIEPQTYVDQSSEKFRQLLKALTMREVNFIRTTDPHHVLAAQEFWRRCALAGDIYKKNYKIKYCVGCELEKSESELVDGGCPLHPTTSLEIIEEENYFFRFSKYQKPLLDLYRQRQEFVIPSSRLHEITAFVERGLEDFSISRLVEKMPWGVPVPDDSRHVMYVWFDALVSYISTLGWPHNTNNFERWWVESGGVVQYAGKDNLRQQSAMWQAMLMSAGLPPSKQIIINGFITSGGQKMSKSLGNVADPLDLVREFGSDALRYFVCRELATFEDGDFTPDKFIHAYNANLANGLGNLVSRIMKMAVLSLGGAVSIKKREWDAEYTRSLDRFEIGKAMDHIWAKITALDQTIQQEAPFKLIKTEPEKAKSIIADLVVELHAIATMLLPFLPTASQSIISLIREHTTPVTPLFSRKEITV